MPDLPTQNSSSIPTPLDVSDQISAPGPAASQSSPVPVSAPTPSVVSPSEQHPPQSPPLPQSGSNPFLVEQGGSGADGSKQSLLVRLPWKYILMLLGVVVLLVSIFFGVRAFLAAGGGEEKGVVEIVYWGITYDEAAIAPQLVAYEKQTGVRVRYVKQAEQDYRERLMSSLVKGGGPDVFEFHNTWVPMFSSHLSVLPAQVIDASSFQSSFYPVVSADVQKGGSYVGVPLSFDGLGLFVNSDILASVDKLPPKTWDELRQIAELVTQKDSEDRIVRAGVAVGLTTNVDYWQDILSLMMLQVGTNPGKPSAPLAQDALSFFTSFPSLGVWDETLPSSGEAFAGGRLAMYFAPAREVASIKRLNPNLNFQVVAAPQLAKLNPADPDVSLASYWLQGVGLKSTHSVESWQFVKYLSLQPQAQALGKDFPYARVDMAPIQMDDPYLGAYVKQGKNARSSYLVAGTFDGPTGINGRISKLYEEAVSGFLARQSVDTTLESLVSGVLEVVASYAPKK